MASTERGAFQALSEHGLRPRKRLGQNFLRDRSFLKHMLDAAHVRPGDRVLEIGAGTGVLTAALARAEAEVLALELDDALHDLLRQEFAAVSNVTLWHGNALAFEPCAHFAGPYKVVGNIPYYITGPVLRHFLEAGCRPDVLALMVQREVAQRFTSSPGHLSLLGLSVQYYAKPEIVTRVPAAAFVPRPKVDSAIVRLTPHLNPAPPEERDAFFRVARAGFSTRRKQLANALATGLDISRQDARDLLAEAGINPTRRAETLSVEEWKRLAALFRRRGGQV